MHDIEPTFQADEVLPWRTALPRHLHQCFRALASAAHQFIPRRRRVTDSALDFHADDFELGIVSQCPRKGLEGFCDGIKLRTALAAHGDGDFVHLEKWRRPDSNGTWTNISLRIREAEENSEAHSRSADSLSGQTR